MIEEIWKDIPGHKGYQASNLGRIKSIPNVIDHPLGRKYTVAGRVRKGLLNHRGYLRIQLLSKGPIYSVHRLVALAWISNPNSYEEINHINFVKTDNRIENLEWCSRKQNDAHARQNNRINAPKGINHWNASLDEIQVKTIKRCLLDGMTAYKLSKYFNVTYGVIGSIRNGKTWGHVSL